MRLLLSKPAPFGAKKPDETHFVWFFFFERIGPRFRPIKMSVSDALPVADGVAAASTSRKAAPLAPRNRAFKGKTDASAAPCNPAHKTARRKYPPQTQLRAGPPQKRLFLLAGLQAARKPAQNTKPRLWSVLLKDRQKHRPYRLPVKPALAVIFA